jgi:hypothetical protein
MVQSPNLIMKVEKPRLEGPNKEGGEKLVQIRKVERSLRVQNNKEGGGSK